MEEGEGVGGTPYFLVGEAERGDTREPCWSALRILTSAWFQQFVGLTSTAREVDPNKSRTNLPGFAKSHVAQSDDRIEGCLHARDLLLERRLRCRRRRSSSPRSR